MTTYIDTIEGEQIQTGFWGADTSKIQLGELPLMTIQQFVKFGGIALTDALIPKASAETRDDWASDARVIRGRVQDLPLLQTTGQFITQSPGELMSQMGTGSQADEGELMTSLAAAAVPTDDAEYYCESPFVVPEDGQSVRFVQNGATVHEISADDFFTLNYSVIRGGMMGWSQYGTYQEVKDAAVVLDTALSPQS